MARMRYAVEGLTMHLSIFLIVCAVLHAIALGVNVGKFVQSSGGDDNEFRVAFYLVLHLVHTIGFIAGALYRFGAFN